MNAFRAQAARKLCSPLTAVILGPLLLFAPVILSGQALFWGLPALQFNPWQAYALEQLKQGLLPLWNPLNGMGAPLLANYQLAFFYPPTWLAYLAGWLGGLPALAWSQSLILAGHLILAGAGMVMFIRSMGLGGLAQTVAGLCFSLGGYLVARNGFFSMIWAAAWLPWLLFLGGKIAQKERGAGFGNLALSAVCVAMQLLAGHAQLTWYSLLLTSLWILFSAWQKGGLRRAFQASLAWGGCVLAGIILSAVQLLPTLEYLQQSQRSSAVGFDSGLTYSFWPWHLLSLVFPDFFGNPGAGNYVGYGSYWEDAVYIGVAGLFFAVSTLPVIFRRKKEPGIGNATSIRPVLSFFWAVAAVGLVFALGRNTPVFLFLYQIVPTFNLFNGPARWLIWTVFGLCVLAAFGVEMFTTAQVRRKRRWRLASVVCLAIALGAGAGWFVLREIQASFIQATAVGALWAFAFTLLAERAPLPGRKSNWAGYLVVFVLADLLMAGSGLIPAVPSYFYNLDVQPRPLTAGIAPGSRYYLPSNDEYFIKFSSFFRTDDFNPIEPWSQLHPVLLPNLNLAWNISTVNNFDPFVPRRYSEWMKQVELVDPETQKILLQAMNVGAIERTDPASVIGVRFESIDPLPRFRFVKCVQFGPALNDALAEIRAGATVIEGNQPGPACTRDGDSPKVEIRMDTPQKTILQVNSPAAGWLVTADSAYPGWKAFVDGQEVEIRQANFIFRALEISPGPHQIQFEYDPVSFKAGAALSLLAWSGLVLTALIYWLRKRQSRL